jgi:hypothetical protein
MEFIHTTKLYIETSVVYAKAEVDEQNQRYEIRGYVANSSIGNEI